MKFRNFLILGLTSAFLLTGCTPGSKSPKKLKFKEDKIITKVKEELILNQEDDYVAYNEPTIQRKINNIYTPKNQNLQIGQMIFINVSENTKATFSGQKQLSKKGNSKIGGGVVTTVAEEGSVKNFVDNHINPLSSIGFETNKNTSFSGKGTHSRQDQFNTTLTAFITEKVSPYIFKIEGEKEMQLDGQYQKIKMSGYIRKQHIKDYSVNSDKIANFKITYHTAGDVTETENQAPLGRLLDYLLW